MVLPVILVAAIVATLALYAHLANKAAAGDLWRSAMTIGLAVGLSRAGLASAGSYTVEHTGGPLQIPGFLFAMLAWPEAVVFGAHRGPVPPTFFVRLGLLLTVTSVAFVAGIALIVRIRQGNRRM